MSRVITGYNSKRIAPEHWASIEPFVRLAIAEFGPADGKQAQSLLAVLTRHVHWCWQTAAYPLDRSVIFRREVIAESIAKGMAGHPKGSRNTYRSRLYAMSDVLLPPTMAAPVIPHIGQADPKSPYSPQDIATLWSWANGQATDYRRVNLKVLLSLGFGAGLTNSEICALQARHVTVDGEGVLIDVPGTSARQVPMLADWEGTIADLSSATLRAEQFLFVPKRDMSTGVSGDNRIPNFVHDANDRPFSVTATRMRVTWMVHHLTVGTPISALQKAAGVKSPQALARYAQFVPGLDVSEFRQAMRGIAKETGTLWGRRS